jgi:hypothetical protein
MFEVNLDQERFTWANDFVLTKLGCDLSKLQSLSIFEFIQPQFHDQLRIAIQNTLTGDPQQYFIWPSKSLNNTIIWWYNTFFKLEAPIYWMQVECINNTEDGGHTFAFMKMQMEALNRQWELNNRLGHLTKSTEGKIQGLGREVQGLQNHLTKIENSVENVKTAAKNALEHAGISRDTSLAVQTQIKKTFSDYEDSQARHTEEILKLITTNVIHDRRMDAFETHIKNSTDIAIQSIQNQTDKASKGISRKITIPLSTLAAVGTAAQWIIQHWVTIKGWVHQFFSI